MSYQVELVNKSTLAPIKFVEVVNEPKINEEINAAYTLNFEAHYESKSDLNRQVLIKVNDQLYQIKKITKRRSDSITLSVQCEHVSYELIIDGSYENKLEFEDTAAGMINRILQGTRFSLGECIGSWSTYYETSTRDKRKQLVDIANLFGGELYFDNFTVNLVHQRGSDKGLDIELGVNLLGATEEIDYVKGTTAYELDLVDLSQITGYELDFSSAELGDTIGIKDNVLGINAKERIIGIEYNPFKRQLPTVTVGDYIRDFTEYIKEEEKKEEEKEKDTKSFFKQFKIGGIDLLEKSSDVTSDVVQYLTDGYVTGVDVSTSYNTLKDSLTGIMATAASTGSKLTILRTIENEVGMLVTTVTELSSTNQLSSETLKAEESVVAVVTERPFKEFVANPKLVETELIKAIGIKITFSDEGSVFFDRFEVGGESVLNVEGNDVTDIIKSYIANPSKSPVATAQKEINKPLVGLNVKLKSEYARWFVTLIHSKNDGNGKWTHTTQNMPIANLINFKVPNDTQDSVILIISNEPWDNILKGKATANAYYKAFGTTFIFKEIIEPWIEEFKIGDQDCLSLEGVVIEKDELKSITAEFFYSREDEFKGLFLKLKEVYKDYDISIKEYAASGSTIHQYSDSYKTKTLPDDLKAISITISKGTKKQILGVKFKQFGIEDSWLEEFKIGTEDCLYLSGILIQKDEFASIVAELPYSKIDDFTGLFLKLKESYKDYSINIREYTDSGSNTHQYSSIDKTKKYPGKLKALTVTISKGTKKQILGVKFSKYEGIEDYWLEEFRIGNVDALSLPSVELPFGTPPTGVIAEIEFKELFELKGLFVNLKEEYKNYNLSVAVFPSDNGNPIYYNDPKERSGLLLPTEDGMIIMVVAVNNEIPEGQTPTENDAKFFGVKFVKKIPEPSETISGVMYAIVERVEYISKTPWASLFFVTNITNFRQNLWDNHHHNFYFETQSFNTEELYPSAFETKNGELVQIVDGVIIAGFTYNPSNIET